MDLARCIWIFIGFGGRCAYGRSPGERSVLFVTTNGATIPALGFGTYGMPRSDMLRMIPAALNAGVRHFDTAQIYRNEAEVGECVAASGLKRKDIFLTTKVWVANYP